MSQRPLLPAEYAVLGLLAMRPMYGYEMARHLGREELTQVWAIEPSSLYTYLRNLLRRGLVACKEARVGLRPPRKVFELTPEGRQVVDVWLRSPVDHMRKVRPDFLLKLYFLRQLDPAGESALVLRQTEVCEALRERLAGRVGCSSGFDQLVAASKLSTVEATLRWLREYAVELKKNVCKDKGLAKEPRVDVLA